jgi:indolepyruvate decarboxylase
MEKATVASVILTNSAQQPVKSIELQLVCITNVTVYIAIPGVLVYRPCIPSENPIYLTDNLTDAAALEEAIEEAAFLLRKSGKTNYFSGG